MNIEDITTINHKNYSNIKAKNIISNNYIKKLITRILLSIILLIGTLIYLKIDNRNFESIKKFVYTDNIKFTKINKWYQDKFGSLIPKVKQDGATVFSNTNIKANNYEKYHDGVKINYEKGSPVSLLYGGIVVFIGEKDNYSNTVIIQGNDGIDYWYGNITNINVNLYDYLEKDTIIGESKDDYIYLVLQKDNNYLEYEKYLE